MKHTILNVPLPVTPFVMALSVFVLSACSTFDREATPAYQQARQSQALEVPPDLSAPGGRASIPEIVAAEATAGDLQEFQRFQQLEQWEEFEQFRTWKEQAAEGEQLDFQAFLAARQAARQSGAEGGGVSIDRNVDGSRDVRIEGVSGEMAWQYLDTALQAMNIDVLESSPDQYTFTVALPDIQESTLLRRSADRFTLEIGRDQRDMVVALMDRRGSRVATEPAQEFLTRLAGQLRIARARLDLENQVVTGAQQAGELRTTEAGHLELDLDDARGRIWDRLDFAIDQVGFTVIERDRDGHLFKFRFITDDQIVPERAGLARLAFWKQQEEMPEGSDVYTVRVDENPQGSTIRVLDWTGQPSDTGDTILELLREKL
jgi:uncharacterized lipoprotein